PHHSVPYIRCPHHSVPYIRCPYYSVPIHQVSPSQCPHTSGVPITVSLPPYIRGTIPTDTNDGALFLPLTPMMGHYSSH
ncbi:unnamed protein product, partial [Staurois parvus]